MMHLSLNNVLSTIMKDDAKFQDRVVTLDSALLPR